MVKFDKKLLLLPVAPFIRYLFYGDKMDIALLYLNLGHSPKFSVGFAFITFFGLRVGDPSNGNFLSFSWRLICAIYSNTRIFSASRIINECSSKSSINLPAFLSK